MRARTCNVINLDWKAQHIIYSGQTLTSCKDPTQDGGAITQHKCRLAVLSQHWRSDYGGCTCTFLPSWLHMLGCSCLTQDCMW